MIYALLLALGEFSWDDLPPVRDSFVERLGAIYEQDPSSGVHSATGWLLRQWGQREAVDRVDQTPLEYDASGHREWFVQGIPCESEGMRYMLHSTFIVFQPRKFAMGSPDNGPDHQFHETEHQVTLTRRIAVCDRELTWSHWDAFEGLQRRQSYALQFSKTLGGSDPVFGIDWFDAVTFCRWLSAQVGWTEDEQCYEDPSLLPKDGRGRPANWPIRLEGAGFRLPTEAEWEFICRGGTRTTYSFGHDEALLVHYAWYRSNAANWSHSAGRKRPNPRGLFDVHGNVFEWCHDWSNEGELRDATNPKGAETGRYRVYRGGCWFDAAYLCRSTCREWNEPTFLVNLLGFRLATVPHNPWERSSEDQSTEKEVWGQ